MSDSSAMRTLACVMLLAIAGAAAAGDELRDPTRPSYLPSETASRTASAPSWRLESIIVSANRRLAVINGRVVGVNDRVNAARVVEILPYEVHLEYEGEIRRISLVPTRVKHPATSMVKR